MKTRFISLILFSVFVLLITNRCGSNKVVPDMCFSKNVKPIIISKCTTSGCHSGGKGNGEGGNFTTYDGIMTKVKAGYPLLSELYTKCNGKNPEMPPSGYSKLTNTELEYIKYWIHTGAKNSDCSSGYTCDTITVNYSSRIKPLFETNCIGCHNPQLSGGGFDLSTYDGVKSSFSRLMGSLNQTTGFSAMPQGGSKLSSCDIRAIQKWMDAGAPNN